jgi:hypothetical protein
MDNLREEKAKAGSLTKRFECVEQRRAKEISLAGFLFCTTEAVFGFGAFPNLP